MVTPMKVVIEQVGNYFVVEVYSETGQLLIRVGFDHAPTEEEIEALLSGGDEECQS
jgi:hypothetical protein